MVRDEGLGAVGGPPTATSRAAGLPVPRRQGAPEEAALLVVYLASERASYIKGSAIWPTAESTSSTIKYKHKGRGNDR